MTIKQMEKRLDALEKRIREYEEQEKPSKSRPTFPTAIEGKYDGVGYATTRKNEVFKISFMTWEDIKLVSDLVRKMCFKQTRSDFSGNRYKIALRNMTDEEYERYTEIFDAVISTLGKYALPRNERGERDV